MNYYGEKRTISKRIVENMRKTTTSVSPKLNTILNFILAKHSFPNLKNPQSLDEKLCRLKLSRFSNDDLIKRCADKYYVREYLSSIGYNALLGHLYASYDSVDDINWDLLPDRFAMKWSFGSGYNIICSDLSNFDRSLAKSRMLEWSRIPYWKLYSEYQYKDIPHHIIVEEYLEGPDGAFPLDYKFYCFNGVATCVMVCVGRETGKPQFYFFDRDWNLLRINKCGIDAPDDFSIPKPTAMDRMFEIANDLSAPFPFVRLDLYVIGDKIQFGEFTFTPSAGFDGNRLVETDLHFGKMLDIGIC